MPGQRLRSRRHACPKRERISEYHSALLAQVLARDVDGKIAIFTTPGVSVQQLVSVMDTVYLTGGRNVQVDKIETQVPYGT